MYTSRSAIARLCEGALMIAIAQILSFLPLYKMPWGGSIDLAMLPIFLYCARWGFGPGMVVSTAHAVLQMLFEGGIAIGWQSIIGDFLLAYMVLGFAGLCKNFYIGSVTGSVLRFAVHYVVGATIWAEYMPPEFFGMTMTSPWIYSALYNGAYMLPDCILVLLVGFLLMKTPAQKYLLPY
ncbi:MAG: energy-coupled thiamine transporter ThiT [Oscillospiraceae bacterium]|nr:energy-coupled thiamine transporter ThiT [Oscillospiraceae bacterium]